MPPSSRSCGSCKACCWIAEIDAFQKPVASWCPHCDLGETLGCTIYEDRPSQCSDFLCAWIRRPEIPIGLSPEKARIVVTDLLDEDDGEWLGYGVWELVPGAAKKKKVVTWMQSVLRDGHRVLIADPRKKEAWEIPGGS